MSTDSYIPMTARVERIEREKAYEAGFAAALSEHEQVGWYNPESGWTFGLGEFTPEEAAEDGTVPLLYRRSVEEPTTQAEPRVIGGSQSSEVPRTPEEPSDA